MDVRALPAFLLLLLASGCATEIATALDEGEANRVMAALDRADIEADKQADPTSEGKFRVLVAREGVAKAISVLHDEQLPRPKTSGVLETVAQGQLVASPTAENAQVVAGIAGDLTRTLESVEGILSARVHLNVPERDVFDHKKEPRATASVLLVHRGSTPPLSSDEVQKLVSGAARGLAPADVSVVTVSRPGAARLQGDSTHVGPIAVRLGSRRLLQAILAALLAVCAALGIATLRLYRRAQRSAAP